MFALLTLLPGPAAEARSTASASRLAARLRAAQERGSAAELEEIGMQATGRDLSLALASPDRKVVLGAIAATPATRDAWVLLTPLAELAARPDRAVAASASAAAARIAGQLEPAALVADEVDRDELVARLEAWRRVAASTGRAAEVRISALEICTSLAAVTGEPATSCTLAAALDPDAEVRRAAFELMPSPLPDEAREIAIRTLASEPVPVVALAAAQALCSGISLRREAPALVVSRLGEDGLGRLHTLVTEPELPPAALLAAAHCLAADASPASKAALASLGSRGPAVIRDLVRRLAKKPPARRRGSKR